MAPDQLPDLGNAVRKIRIDLGVDVEFPPLSAFHPPEPMIEGWQRPVVMVGTVHYPEAGILWGGFSIKPALRGAEPADIVAHRDHPEFPHQPTTDQWFDEPQFEATTPSAGTRCCR